GENAAHVLRVHEEYRRPVRADARLAEHARALGLELGLGGVDVRHLEADMMLAAERILFDEFGDGRAVAERLDQLDLAVGRIDEADAHALRGKVERRSMRLGAENIAVKLEALLDRRGGDPDMV